MGELKSEYLSLLLSANSTMSAISLGLGSEFCLLGFFLNQEKPLRFEPGMNQIKKKVNPDPSPPSLLGSEIVRISAFFLFKLNRHTEIDCTKGLLFC